MTMTTTYSAVRNITAEDGRFVLTFPYNREAVDAVKTLCVGARWNPERRIWTAPGNSNVAGSLRVLEVDYGFKVDALAEDLAQSLGGRQDASHATNGTTEFKGLGKTLRPYQVAGIEYALKAKRTFIGDDTGLGKTPQALVTVKELGAYPALIVTTKTQVGHMKKEIPKWLPGATFEVINGKTTELKAGVQFFITTHGQLSLNPKVFGLRKETLSRKTSFYQERAPFGALILDESHKFGGDGSQRTKAALAMAKGVDVLLLLSATKFKNRPAELIPQLKIMRRLDELGGWKRFVVRYCAGYRNHFGWQIGGASHEVELNQALRALCMIRREKHEVMPELPEKQRISFPLEITNRKEYNSAQKAIVKWLRDKAYEDEEFLISISHLPQWEQDERRLEYAKSAEMRARRAEQLVKINELRRLAGLGKVEAVTEWIEDFLESGEKLIVFAWHREVQEHLVKHFPDAARIIADDSANVRAKYIERFQEDDDCKLIICSIQAASEGWSGTAASNVAFVELGWNPATHDQAEDRCYGRIDDPHGATAYYLLGENTIDEWTAELIESKRDIFKKATGSTRDDDSILEGLVKKLADSS